MGLDFSAPPRLPLDENENGSTTQSASFHVFESFFLDGNFKEYLEFFLNRPVADILNDAEKDRPIQAKFWERLNSGGMFNYFPEDTPQPMGYGGVRNMDVSPLDSKQRETAKIALDNLDDTRISADIIYAAMVGFTRAIDERKITFMAANSKLPLGQFIQIADLQINGSLPNVLFTSNIAPRLAEAFLGAHNADSIDFRTASVSALKNAFKGQAFHATGKRIDQRTVVKCPFSNSISRIFAFSPREIKGSITIEETPIPGALPAYIFNAVQNASPDLKYAPLWLTPSKEPLVKPEVPRSFSPLLEVNIVESSSDAPRQELLL